MCAHGLGQCGPVGRVGTAYTTVSCGPPPLRANAAYAHYSMATWRACRIVNSHRRVWCRRRTPCAQNAYLSMCIRIVLWCGDRGKCQTGVTRARAVCARTRIVRGTAQGGSVWIIGYVRWVDLGKGKIDGRVLGDTWMVDGQRAARGGVHVGACGGAGCGGGWPGGARAPRML